MNRQDAVREAVPQPQLGHRRQQTMFKEGCSDPPAQARPVTSPRVTAYQVARASNALESGRCNGPNRRPNHQTGQRHEHLQLFHWRSPKVDRYMMSISRRFDLTVIGGGGGVNGEVCFEWSGSSFGRRHSPKNGRVLRCLANALRGLRPSTSVLPERAFMIRGMTRVHVCGSALVRGATTSPPVLAADSQGRLRRSSA